MSADDITVKSTGGGYVVTYEGRTAAVGGFSYATPDAMLRAAERAESDRQGRYEYQARRYRALAAYVTAQQATETARRTAQRRERAAATRAHNRDPFGFVAAAERNGAP
jgi:hypothetical protein